MLTAATPARGGPAPITRAHARIAWAAASVVLAAAVAATLLGADLVRAAPASGELAPALLLVAVVLVTFDLVMAYVLTARMRRSAARRAPAGNLAGVQTIVAAALCLGSALVSCVFYFVTRESVILLLVAPCALVLAHWFPSGTRWEALGGGRGVGEANGGVRS